MCEDISSSTFNIPILSLARSRVVYLLPLIKWRPHCLSARTQRERMCHEQSSETFPTVPARINWPSTDTWNNEEWWTKWERGSELWNHARNNGRSEESGVMRRVKRNRRGVTGWQRWQVRLSKCDKGAELLSLLSSSRFQRLSLTLMSHHICYII